jgi:hypothetical protein
MSNSTLKAQYATVAEDKNGSTTQLKKTLAQSIRDLRKNSNPDLTNENLFKEEVADSTFAEADNTASSGQYYSTLPKNLRRGVQKKVYL